MNDNRIDKNTDISNSETKVPEELTSTGQFSGLESEDYAEEEVDIIEPFDPNEIDVITQQRTVGQIMDRLKYGEIDLSPDFQRRANLWKKTQKSGLIESMLLRIPIPSLYVSEDKDGKFQVVDGLQRICSIAHFVDFTSLNKCLETKLVPLRLTGLQSLSSDLEGRSFDELPRPLQRRIIETELTLHIIRAGTPVNVKFNIFSRINQSGLPLKAQEIRNAIFPGVWRQHIRCMAESNKFKRATDNKIKGERLEDYELVLRFAALYSLPGERIRPSRENLDDFLNEFVEKRSANWTAQDWDDVKNSFYQVMDSAPVIFRSHAFRKYYDKYDTRKPINRSLFESEAVAISGLTTEEQTILGQRSDQVLEKLGRKLTRDESFINSLLYATGRGSSSNNRLKTLNEIFDEVLNA